VILLVVGAVGAGGVAALPATHPVDRLPAGAATAVLSARRAPTALAHELGGLRLRADLDGALGGVTACLLARTGDETLVSRTPERSLPPASNQKLFVGAVALSALGPEFRYVTRVVATSAPHDGAVGDLWLVGAGDPVLATPEYEAFLPTQALHAQHLTTSLAALADAVVAAGVRVVHGAVRGDDSRYDRTRTVPTWKPVYLSDHEVGPLGALTVNDGWLTWKPRITVAPDPAAYAASELARLLAARGVTVEGGTGSGDAPATVHAVASVRSLPLRDIVAMMLRESHNLSAELLVRELGRVLGKGATTPAGAAAVEHALSGLGVPTDGVHLVDGSGLDTANRAPCRSLFAALELGRQERYRALWDGLAVAAHTGTLVKRLTGTVLDGKLRVKTGSIKNVVGLTGFVDGHQVVEFAFLAAGPFDDAAGRALQDRIARILYDYPAVPDVSALGPR
jgi:D-alanyl-D-alanine carboxypeptidase/D-alanyl-D-alanine-endopeptidase (penicillin-binding protein 4)